MIDSRSAGVLIKGDPPRIDCTPGKLFNQEEYLAYKTERRGMSTSAIYDQLSVILQDVFDEDDLVATPEMTADDVDGWDSLAHLRLVAAVEKKFGIRFAASQISGLQNVGELVALIEAKQAA